MLVNVDTPGTVSPDHSMLEVVSAMEKADLSSKNIFYPKERGLYKFEGIKLSGLQLCFRAKNDDALFYSIKLTKEGGKRGIGIHSKFIKEMNLFLIQNDIPIKDLDSDCQYYDSCKLAHYYTTNPDVCIKLSKILLEMNQFDLIDVNKSLLDEFLNF